MWDFADLTQQSRLASVKGPESLRRGAKSAQSAAGVYLRTLLIHGGRAAVYAARRGTDARSPWLNRL
jgi:hypothetical protein